MLRFKQTERELKSMLNAVFYSRPEHERFEANRKFIAVWDRIAAFPGILNFAFDSLKKEISVLKPADKKFCLVTWNIPKDDGTHAFFGYLFVNNNKRIKKGFLKHEIIESYEYFKLLDFSSTVKSPESYVGSPEKWFGMLYTCVIHCDCYYALLGWDGNDKLTRRKFVDALYFKSDGTPVFGKDIFKIPHKNPRRMMFQYSSDVTMSLKYDEGNNQIVFDHLASRQDGAQLNEQFQYYGPDGSFDALEYKKGKWAYTEDVDARNKKSENDNVRKPDPKKQKPIYKPR